LTINSYTADRILAGTITVSSGAITVLPDSVIDVLGGSLSIIDVNSMPVSVSSGSYIPVNASYGGIIVGSLYGGYSTGVISQPSGSTITVTQTVTLAQPETGTITINKENKQDDSQALQIKKRQDAQRKPLRAIIGDKRAIDKEEDIG
jgi:hypothetical protein